MGHFKGVSPRDFSRGLILKCYKSDTFMGLLNVSLLIRVLDETRILDPSNSCHFSEFAVMGTQCC